MSTWPNLRRLIPSRQPPSDVEAPRRAPDPQEIAAARRQWREAIHANRNIATISMQIARKMQQASMLAQRAADEAIAEVRKSREHAG